MEKEQEKEQKQKKANQKEVNQEYVKQISEKEQKTQEALSYFVKKGFLLDKDLARFFAELDDVGLAEEILRRISSLSQTRLITKAQIAVHFNDVKPLFLGVTKEKKEVVEDFFKALPSVELEQGMASETGKEKTSADVKKNKGFKILSPDVSGDRKIEVKDFVTHFKNRYNFLKDLLKTREGLTNLVSINKISHSGDFSVIGLISSKRITKNKNLLLEVEDLTGRITVLANQSKPEVFEKAKNLVLDDIVGLRCSGNKDILFVNDVFLPDATLPEKGKLDQEVYALFISDMHVGSKNFLEENFAKFINWLNGEGCTEEQREKLEKIKYMFVVGDTVDGIGIFPGQEDLLKIKNMEEQYRILASYLKKVPKHITIIMCPGQHDAVRVPEPQPPVDKEFAKPLLDIENLVLVSNPSSIELSDETGKKINVLMYHGASLHSWINEIEELRVTNAHLNPAKAVKYLLEHRHLSPTHSATTYVPNEEFDPMVIKEVPNIFTTGEVHKTDVDMYNNTLIICNSCWQSTTSYEEKVGNQPDPCKVPMLNLKTYEIKILDFS